VPFSQLEGVFLGMSDSELRQARPGVVGSGETGYTETIGGSMVAYSFGGYFGGTGTFTSTGLQQVAISDEVSIPPPDVGTLRNQLGLVGDSVYCRMRTRSDDSSQPLVWFAGRQGSYELLIGIEPARIYTHRDGVDTIHSRVVRLLRGVGAQENAPPVVPCPAASR
jgi:hypothetical protein